MLPLVCEDTFEVFYMIQKINHKKENGNIIIVLMAFIFKLYCLNTIISLIVILLLYINYQQQTVTASTGIEELCRPGRTLQMWVGTNPKTGTLHEGQTLQIWTSIWIRKVCK